MSAEQIPVPNLKPSQAARVIARVSPRDGVVSIGPVLPDDLGALFVWMNDALAALGDFSYRPVDCVAYKGWLDGQVQTGNQILFTIRMADPPRPLGFVMFKNMQPAFRAAELGVRIGLEADRGKGYGARAARLALAYAWSTLNLHRLFLTAFADNGRARAAWRRAGFQEEGLMRHAAYTGGAWRDVVMMAAINPGEAPQENLWNEKNAAPQRNMKATM